VLLCPLFGNDELCAYRAKRTWAQSLASAGHAVLRIDLPGTGDSPGGPHDRGLVDAWIESLSSAAGWLKRERAGARVVAIGLDLGGMLAYCAAAADAAIDDLVLWSVPSRGRTLVRRQRALARIESSTEQSDGEQQAAPIDDGSLASAGFLLSRETLSSLEGLDLAALELPRASKRRALLLQRDGLDVDARLRSALEDAGADTEVLPGPGYGEMVAVPQASYPPLEVFTTVERWLARPDDERQAQRSPTASQTADDDRSCLELNVAGTLVRERPVTIAAGDVNMFGILAEPVASDAPSELCAVLLNAGAIRHIGPGRMWVEIARRWAARGVPTLRIDYAGIGDAEGQPEALRENGEFYVERAMDESRTMLGALVEHGLTQRVVLAGLCSGAYWALHAAAQDERVAGAYLVNPRVLVWNDDLLGIRNARNLRKALKPRTWTKLARGQITRDRIRDITSGAVVSMRRLPAAHQQAAHESEVLDDVLSSVQAAGTEVLMLFGEGEPMLEELERDGTLERLAERPNVRVDRIAGPSSHTLEPLSAQRAVHEALDQALGRRIAAAQAADRGVESPALARAPSGHDAE
jgi:alpha-beta hydrolase superfamily lysophospholipase